MLARGHKHFNNYIFFVVHITTIIIKIKINQ